MSSDTKSEEETQREKALRECRFSIGDMALAEVIGATFGGNGFTHKEQLMVVADTIRKYRESLRA